MAYVAQKPICTSFCIGARARGNGASHFGLSFRPESDLRRPSNTDHSRDGLCRLPFSALPRGHGACPVLQQGGAAVLRRDYRQSCGDYRLETAAFRACMDRNGESLSKSCVSALVASGEVTQAEVSRRKTAIKQTRWQQPSLELPLAR